MAPFNMRILVHSATQMSSQDPLKGLEIDLNTDGIAFITEMEGCTCVVMSNGATLKISETREAMRRTWDDHYDPR